MLDGEGMDGWTNKQMMEGVINAMGLKMETSGKDSAGLGGKKKKKGASPKEEHRLQAPLTAPSPPPAQVSKYFTTLRCYSLPEGSLNVGSVRICSLSPSRHTLHDQ